jgi:hypothetical protein
VTLPLEALAALLSAAGRAAGLPEPLLALLPALARELLPLLERHESGEPLPEIVRARLGDDAGLVAKLLERDLADKN